MGRVTPWSELANAIIVQAVRDFRAARKLWKRHPDNPRAKASVQELLDFIQSDWFGILTDIEPVYIISKLMEEDDSVRGGSEEYDSVRLHAAGNDPEP